MNASYNHIPCFYFSNFFAQIFSSLLISCFLFNFLFFFVPFFFWPHPFPSHLFHGPLLSPQFIHTYSAAGTPGNALLKFRKLNIFFLPNPSTSAVVIHTQGLSELSYTKVPCCKNVHGPATSSVRRFSNSRFRRPMIDNDAGACQAADCCSV